MEVREVPSGWQKKRISDIAPLQRGFDLPVKELKEGSYPVVYSNGIGYYHKFYKIKGPGVITGRSGTIGTVHYIEENYWPHNTTLWVTDFKCNDPKYIYFLFSYIDIEQFATGSGVPTLNRNDVHLFEALCPPFPEQQAIAEALSDVDAVISSLTKLISKKKNIKQGAMQELLTGKKKLEGFINEIKYTSLSSLCNTFCDGDWIESKDQSDEGYRLVQTGNIGVGRFLDKSDKKRYISRETFDRLSCTEVFYDDVLVSRLPEPAGRACLVPELKEPMITAVDCTILRFTNYNPVLFVNYSQTFEYQKQISTMLGGSTRQRISRKELGKVLVPFFPSDKEQTAIANILSDIDAEIEVLEQKLNKYKAIKQGMMQELLTGRIRLI